MKLSEMKALYLRAKDAYYNGKSEIMSDAAFDRLEDTIRKRSPEWEELDKTGVRISDKKEEVALCWPMPSLEKAYPDDVPSFAKRSKGPHFGMWKLDGTSLQGLYDRGTPKALITRGDGMVGRDVSYLIPKLVEFGLIPARIPTRNRTVFRFEALMKKDVFAEKYSREAAGDDGFDNARAMVNGLFNRSWSSRALRDVSMVVLGVYHNEDISTVRQGLNKAKQWGFETVPFFEVQPNRAFLEAALAEAR